jgi:hypothetical protein
MTQPLNNFWVGNYGVYEIPIGLVCKLTKHGYPDKRHISSVPFMQWVDQQEVNAAHAMDGGEQEAITLEGTRISSGYSSDKPSVTDISRAI